MKVFGWTEIDEACKTHRGRGPELLSTPRTCSERAMNLICQWSAIDFSKLTCQSTFFWIPRILTLRNINYRAAVLYHFSGWHEQGSYGSGLGHCSCSIPWYLPGSAICCAPLNYSDAIYSRWLRGWGKSGLQLSTDCSIQHYYVVRNLTLYYQDQCWILLV